jgi:hypothetical protein
MSETTLAVPVAKARLKLFNEMSPATQNVAKEFEQKVAKVSAGKVLLWYALGVKINAMLENENTYGSNAVQQLADYFNVAGGKTFLYSLKQFALTFDEAYIKAKAQLSTSGGEQLSINHWLQLAKIEDENGREKMFNKIMKENLSVGDLITAIKAGVAGAKKNERSGGRKPKISSNPLAGLQSIISLSTKFTNFEEAANVEVLQRLEELDDEQVTPELVSRTEAAKEKVESVIVSAQSLYNSLNDKITHMRDLLKPAEENSADADTGADTDNDPEDHEQAVQAEQPAPTKKKKKKKKKAQPA